MNGKRFCRLISACLCALCVFFSAGASAQTSSGYRPDSAFYISAYNDGLFYNDQNDAAAYIANAMWHMFGAVDDGRKNRPIGRS